MANPWPSADNASWPGGEWLEIWNSGQSNIDLTGWSVVDNAGNIIPFNESHLIGSSTIIGPDEYQKKVNSSHHGEYSPMEAKPSPTMAKRNSI